MKNFIEKHETLTAILLIVLYVVVNSFVKSNFGTASIAGLVINTVFSIFLIILMISSKRTAYYGLTKPCNSKKLLYFIPLILIASINLWNGINVTTQVSDIVLYMLVMVNVGFIEEVIFRGFLFKMMAKDNMKSAIIVSSLTFGIGHIVNLLSGAAIVPTLIQIVYAVAIGFLFVTIFKKSKSLVPCIICHIVINATSIFNVENTLSTYIAPVVLLIVPIVYSIYAYKTVKE